MINIVTNVVGLLLPTIKFWKFQWIHQ